MRSVQFVADPPRPWTKTPGSVTPSGLAGAVRTNTSPMSNRMRSPGHGEIGPPGPAFAPRSDADAEPLTCANEASGGNWSVMPSKRTRRYNHKSDGHLEQPMHKRQALAVQLDDPPRRNARIGLLGRRVPGEHVADDA